MTQRPFDEAKRRQPDSGESGYGAAAPIFRPFDPLGEFRVYVRNLPHWRQSGATYFVTFRQNDSIPENVLAEWLDIRSRWLIAHQLDEHLKRRDPGRFAQMYRQIHEGVRREFERRQARMLHHELDRCHGSCVLRYEAARKCVCDALQFFDGQRLWLGDRVVMPNHVHALLIPHSAWELEDVLASIKKWTSRQIREWLTTQPLEIQPAGPANNQPRFWQHESYDRIVRDLEELQRLRRYIFQNPDAAKLSPSDYTYQAASWLDQYAPITP